MSEPIVTCDKCSAHLVVVPDGRGFPPDIAKRKLRKQCRAKGCAGEPQYQAGLDPALSRRLARLAAFQAFVDSLQAEQGPVTADELQAIQDEWLGRGP